jgi:hypothetical protein
MCFGAKRNCLLERSEGPASSPDFSPAVPAPDDDFRHAAFGNHCVHKSYKRQFSSFPGDIFAVNY